MKLKCKYIQRKLLLRRVFREMNTAWKLDDLLDGVRFKALMIRWEKLSNLKIKLNSYQENQLIEHHSKVRNIDPDPDTINRIGLGDEYED